MEPTEAITVVLIVGMTCGIPLLGLTLRFSLKPLVEAFIRLREAQLGASQVQQLQARVDYLERQLELRGLMDRAPSTSLQQLAPEHLPIVTKDRERI
ncbi:hypothetical protein [Hyalangium versicolor]|uniref:hypothetical protein n=1 Tax=Hyalangium versicolor TaxID=2861190 RepID=UPI001CCDCC48|nr:hypothetical protein [Hyalangium versicolor]